MPRHFVLIALMAVLCCAALVSPAGAQKKEVKPIETWIGSVENRELQKEAPSEGYIADEKKWARLWGMWGRAGKAPAVDFKKELILIATTVGSRLQMRPSVNNQGNLTFPALGTRDLRPGFRYQILRISRDGVKTINGKAPAGG